MPFAEPLPLDSAAGIGVSSTNLPPDSLGQLTEAEDRLAEELQLDNGVHRLAKMVGVKDMKNCLRIESEMFEADLRAGHKLAYEEGIPLAGGSGEDEMEIMSGRDVHLHYYQPEKKPEPAVPTETPAPLAVPVAAPAEQRSVVGRAVDTVAAVAPKVAAAVPVVTRLGKVGKALLVGGPIAAAVVGGAMIPEAIRWWNSKPAEVAPAEPPANAAPSINIGGKEYELRLGK
jgi:hypothetical protein